jgi:hypothetical protein
MVPTDDQSSPAVEPGFLMESPMDHDKLRLECLRIAATLDIPPERVVAVAEEFFAFIVSQARKATS